MFEPHHKTYAGIGNREIPDFVSAYLRKTGFMMAQNQWILRSGGAVGSDSAFAEGASACGGLCEVYRAKYATPEARHEAQKHHPAWEACQPYARDLLARNVQIILGRHLNDPVDLVLCYAVDEERGGTALALRVARAHNIPVINFAKTPAAGLHESQEMP